MELQVPAVPSTLSAAGADGSDPHTPRALLEPDPKSNLTPPLSGKRLVTHPRLSLNPNTTGCFCALDHGFRIPHTPNFTETCVFFPFTFASSELRPWACV